MMVDASLNRFLSILEEEEPGSHGPKLWWLRAWRTHVVWNPLCENSTTFSEPSGLLLVGGGGCSEPSISDTAQLQHGKWLWRKQCSGYEKLTKNRKKLKRPDFSDFGFLRIPDYLIALSSKNFRDLMVSRAKGERALSSDKGDEDAAFELILSRIPASLFVVVVFLNIPLIVAALLMNVAPGVSFVIFALLAFYVPLKFSLLLVAIGDLALSVVVAKWNHSRGKLKGWCFFDVYGKARFPLAALSLVLAVWSVYSGSIGGIVYG